MEKTKFLTLKSRIQDTVNPSAFVSLFLVSFLFLLISAIWKMICLFAWICKTDHEAEKELSGIALGGRLVNSPVAWK